MAKLIDDTKKNASNSLVKNVGNKVKESVKEAKTQKEQKTQQKTVQKPVQNAVQESRNDSVGAQSIVKAQKRYVDIKEDLTQKYRNNEIDLNDDRLQTIFKTEASKNKSPYANERQKVYFEQQKFEEANKVERAVDFRNKDTEDLYKEFGEDRVKNIALNKIDYDTEIQDIDAKMSELNDFLQSSNDMNANIEGTKQLRELGEQKKKLTEDKEIRDRFYRNMNDLEYLEYGSDREKSDVADVVNARTDSIGERIVKGTGANALGIIQSGLALFDTIKDVNQEITADEMTRRAVYNLEHGNIDQETYDTIIQDAQKLRDFTVNDERNVSQQLRREINQMNMEIQEGLSTPEKFAVDSINGTTNFLMQYALFSMIGTLGSGASILSKEGMAVAQKVGEVGSLVSMSSQSGTQKYYELIDEGYDPNTAFLNATATGLISYMTEKIGMDNFVAVMSGKAGQSAFGQIVNSISKGGLKNYYAQSITSGFMAEGLEELVEGIVDPIADAVTLGKPIEYNAGDLFYSFLVGGMSGALMSGAGAIQGSRFVVNTKAQYNALSNDIETARQLLADPDITEEERGMLQYCINMGEEALTNFNELSAVSKGVTTLNDIVEPTSKADGDSALAEGVYPEAVKLSQDIQSRNEALQKVTGEIRGITQEWLLNNGIDINVDAYASQSAETRNEIKKTSDYAQKLGKKVRFSSDAEMKNTVAESMRKNGVSEEKINDLINDEALFVDGFVRDGEIVINAERSRYGQLSTFVHELTHGTESSQYYNTLLTAVKEYLGEDYDSMLSSTKEMYDGIADDSEHELVAKATQDSLLLGNEEFLENLVKYNESLAYRLLSGIRSLTDGSVKSQVERNFMKAFRDAGKNANENAQFLIGHDKDGIPVYDRAELVEALKKYGHEKSFKGKLKAYLNERYAGRLFNVADFYDAAFTNETAGEMVYPSRRPGDAEWYAKTTAFTDLEPLLAGAKIKDLNTDKKNEGKTFDHFTTEFGIKNGEDIDYWQFIVNCKVFNDGFVRIYDISSGDYKRSGNALSQGVIPAESTPSKNNISNPSEEVKRADLIDDLVQFTKNYMEDMDFGDYMDVGSYREQIIDSLKDNPQGLIETLEDYIYDHEGEEGVDEAEALLNRVNSFVNGEEVNDASETVQDKVIVSGSEGSAAPQFSLSTWNSTDKETVKNDLVKTLGVSEQKADKWIEDVNGVAKMIADDRTRLDYEPNSHYSAMKSNDEYVASMDMSTLCKKRELLQGTIDEIQNRLPNYNIDGPEYTKVRQMMKDRGYEVACGFCYVESRRKELGNVAKKFIDSRNYNGLTIRDLTTVQGVNELQKSHPDIYEDFVKFNNKRGSGKVNLVESRTEYRGEIMKLTKAQINKITRIGGLRLQSYSDFETPHMIDMMQIVIDMSRRGLTSQAYTKIPNFADAFGDTGIKINESLVCKGVDENGELIFDDVEGMPHDIAFEIRDRHPENVGTILVGKDDETIRAAMADGRIDFIIPFHRSGWGQAEYERLGITGYQDYTSQQKEYWITPKTKNNGKTENAPEDQFYPIDYWDYSKSGKENAETYLRLCADNGRIPKFSKFLVDNGDGSWSLQPDGSTDGYWKMLIDFKMYDNNGVGAPQQKVQPIFNNEVNQRIMNEYDGEHRINRFAPDVVEEFVKEHQNDRTQFSLGLGRGNGYDGYSMSNNARSAYEDGRKPISQFDSDDVSDFNDSLEEMGISTKVKSVAAFKRLMQSYGSSGEWHHTSSYYNTTDFYDPSSVLEKLSDGSITDEAIKEANNYKAPKQNTKIHHGDFHYLEWEGTRKHPKAVSHTLTDVDIEERGSFYYVYDENGKEIVRKKIGSNGTSIVDYQERANREQERIRAERERYDNGDQGFKEFMDSVNGPFDYETSMSGNIYPRGKKPNSYYHEHPEEFYEVGDRVYRNTSKGYRTFEWNGTDFEQVKDGTQFSLTLSDARKKADDNNLRNDYGIFYANIFGNRNVKISDDSNTAVYNALNEAYENGTVSEETRNELYKAILEETKEEIPVDTPYDGEEMRKYLRSHKISINSLMNTDLRDDKHSSGGYGDFGQSSDWRDYMRSHAKYYNFRREGGTDVDKVFQEFAELYPSSVDPNLSGAKDQLDAMVEAVENNMPRSETRYATQYGEEQFDQWVDEQIDKMVEDVQKTKEFREKMDNGELTVTNEELSKVLTEKFSSEKFQKKLDENRKALIDGAAAWVPNYGVIRDKFPMVDEQVIAEATFETIAFGSMSDATLDKIFDNIVENDVGRELTGNRINEYIQDMVDYIRDTIDLDTQYKANQSFNDSVAGRTNKILNAFEGKDNIDTYDKVEADKVLRDSIEKKRLTTRERISDNVATIMELGNNKINSFAMKTMWDYGKIVAGKDENVVNAWNELMNEPFFEAQTTLKNILESEGEILENTIKETGIKGNTDEAKAVGWIIEGHKQDNTPYTLEDLKKDFSEKAKNGKPKWENIKQFADAYTTTMDRMYESINETLLKAYGDAEVTSELRLAKLYSEVHNLEYAIEDLEEKIKKSPTKQLYNELAKARQDLKRSQRAYETYKKRVDERNDKGRETLQYRKNYFHHIKDGHPLAAAKRVLNNIKELRANKKSGIPSELIGISERTKPLTRWSGIFMHQGMNDYSSDGVASWKDYIREYADIMTFDPLTMYYRDVINEMRSQDTGYDMNHVEGWLENWVNGMDRKSEVADRWVRDNVNEGGIEFIRKINALSKKNAVMGNLGSALVQFGNLPNGLMVMSKNGGKGATADFIGGLASYYKGLVSGKPNTKQSSFLGVRYFDIDTKDVGFYDKSQNVMNAVMSFGDKTVAEILWNGFYKQGQRLGKSNIIQYADEMTRRSIAGRDVGEIPNTLRSSVVNLVIPFQVEVNNQWQQMKDVATDPFKSKQGRGSAAASSVGGMTALVVSSWLMNTIFEALLGRRPLYDPLDAFLDAIKNDEDEETVVMRLIGETMGQIPGGQFIPGLLGMSENEAKNMFGESDPSRYGTGNIGLSAMIKIITELKDDPLSAISDTLANFNPFGGGKQIQRFIEGMQGMGVLPQFNQNYDEESGSFLNPKNWSRSTAAYNNNGQIKYENDPSNVFDYVRSVLGGKWATTGAREYIDSGFKAYSNTATNIADVLSSIGSPTYRKMFSGTVSNASAQEFRDYLESEGIYQDFMDEVNRRYDEHVASTDDPKSYAEFVKQFGITKSVAGGTYEPKESVQTEAEPQKEESNFDFFSFLRNEKEEISDLYSEKADASAEEKEEIQEEIDKKQKNLQNNVYSNYSSSRKMDEKKTKTFQSAMDLDGLYKDSNGNISDDRKGDSKKVRNSEAIETRKALEDMGEYENVLDYIAQYGLDYSDFGLTKTVVGWGDSKFDSEYAEMFGGESSDKASDKASTKTSYRSSGSRRSGSRSTASSDLARHSSAVLSRSKNNRYSTTMSLLTQLENARRKNSTLKSYKDYMKKRG